MLATDNGERSIPGRLSLSNGLPSAITYWLGSNEFTVFMAYKRVVQCPFRIPDELTICEPLPGGRGSNVFTVEIVSLALTNFRAASTGPSELLQPNRGVTVVERVAHGSAQVTSIKGRPSKRASVGMAGRYTMGRRPWTKWVLLGTLLVPLLFFACATFRR